MDATLKGTGSRSLVGNSAAVATVSTAVFSSAGLFQIGNWCRGWGSNPQVPFGTADFKSAASTSSATPARDSS